MTPTRYTHGHADSVLRSHRWRTADNSCAYLLPFLAPGTSVLDVGCGPGTITADLAALVAPGQVIGIDASAAVIAAAGDAVNGGNLSFAVGDVDDLPFDDDSFDVVHAHQVLQHVSDPVAALREMRRVCRPGGLVAARDADYAAMAWYPRLPQLDDWMTLYQQVARNNGAEPDGGRYLRHWAHRAGFEEVTSSASVWCYADQVEREWWGGLWADRVVDSGLAQQALAAGFADAAGLTALADGWRAWTAHPDAWFAVLNGEILCRA